LNVKPTATSAGLDHRQMWRTNLIIRMFS